VGGRKPVGTVATGFLVGARVIVGALVGVSVVVGALVGARVGALVGLRVGALVGLGVGALVGGHVIAEGADGTRRGVKKVAIALPNSAYSNNLSRSIHYATVSGIPTGSKSALHTSGSSSTEIK
jgi:hypothetical protein